MDLEDVSRPPAAIGPRERALAEGVASLGDADLLAILLGTGVAGRPVTFLAAALLDAYGGLEGLARLGPSALSDERGVGPAKALRVAAALELGARVVRRPTAVPAVIANSAEVAAHMAARIGRLLHEELWLLSLDGRNRLRGMRRVAQGGLHGLMVKPCDVLRAAIYDAATSMILVHNHPSGDPSPSREDLTLTRAMAEAGAAAGLPLVDHVIITPSGRYVSLLDLGVLGPS